MNSSDGLLESDSIRDRAGQTASLRVSSLMLATRTQASALAMVASKSLAAGWIAAEYPAFGQATDIRVGAIHFGIASRASPSSKLILSMALLRVGMAHVP